MAKTKLLMLKGLPGSGKTTFAFDWVNQSPKRSRVSRDDLRSSLFGEMGLLDPAKEAVITKIIEQQARSLLMRGYDVVVDATNMANRYARNWANIAHSVGAEFDVIMFPVPIEECVYNDQNRDKRVGRNVIESMAAKYNVPASGELRAPVLDDTHELIKPYRGVGEVAVIVDIDGTLAIHDGRSPYDYSKVTQDKPNQDVVNLVNDLYSVGYRVIITSGRPDSVRAETADWLTKYVEWDHLFMREEGDTRPDYVVKREILETCIAPLDCDIVGVFDDRNQVVNMWRDMGLTCFQVAEGNF